MRPRIVEYLNDAIGGEIWGWVIPTPAVVYALMMLAMLVLFVRRAAQSDQSKYHALGAALWAMAGGLIGARLLFLLFHIDRVLVTPEMIFNLSGATMSFGAYLGGALGFILYIRRNSLPGLKYLDVCASILGLGPFIGRWSCFLNGDDFGTLSNAPWAVSFPHGSYPFAHQVELGLLDPLQALSLPVHPVQLYLSLNGLFLFLLFTWLWKKKTFAPGLLFGWYWIAYPAIRLLIEFFRGGVEPNVFGILTAPQATTLMLLFGGIVMTVSLYIYHNKTMPENVQSYVVRH
jgi:phosphatidylglycerol---prolipoprotein diacylglyceryl transferase